MAGGQIAVIKDSIAALKASYAFDNFSPKFAFDSGTSIGSIKLDTIFSRADVEQWKNWLGTTTWEIRSLFQSC